MFIKKFTEIGNLYVFTEVYSDTLYALLHVLLKVFSVAYILMDMNSVFKKNVRVQFRVYKHA